MEVILSTNRTGDDHYFDSQVDSSEGGMGPYWAIHWGSGIIKRLRTPDLGRYISSQWGCSEYSTVLTAPPLRGNISPKILGRYISAVYPSFHEPLSSQCCFQLICLKS